MSESIYIETVAILLDLSEAIMVTGVESSTMVHVEDTLSEECAAYAEDTANVEGLAAMMDQEDMVEGLDMAQDGVEEKYG